MHPFDILVLGDINVDLILGPQARPIFGQVETLVADAELTVGGSGAIFAMGAARLGLRVGQCGVVGDDSFGRFLLASLHSRGVDTRGVVILPSAKTGVSVHLNADGDRAILTHLGTIDTLSVEMIAPDLLAQTRHLHITSYFLQHNLRAGLPDLLRRLRATGTTVSLDTNWDPSESWDHGLTALLALVDVFLPNAQEALAISGQPTVEQALATLAATIPTVVVKQGAAGASCRRGDQVVHDPGFALPSVIDTTGAGDSFNAGFLYGLLHGWNLDAALALACASGAASTQAVGGTAAQPTLAQAKELIRHRNEAASTAAMLQ